MSREASLTLPVPTESRPRLTATAPPRSQGHPAGFFSSLMGLTPFLCEPPLTTKEKQITGSPFLPRSHILLAKSTSGHTRKASVLGLNQEGEG